MDFFYIGLPTEARFWSMNLSKLASPPCPDCIIESHFFLFCYKRSLFAFSFKMCITDPLNCLLLHSHNHNHGALDLEESFDLQKFEEV